MYHRARAEDIQRFLAKVVFADSGCWLWTGRCDGNGYGQFWYRGQARGSHRVAWVIFRGGIRNGMAIDHKHTSCPHNCVNPDHLRVLHHMENSRDGGFRRWGKKMTLQDDDLPT